MKRLTWLTAVILTVAACGGSDSDDASTATSATTTATTGGTETTTGSSGEAEFVISHVVFGDDGFVSVTNVGDASGNLEGWQLCQRPAYFGIGSIDVAAGETVHFTTGDTGNLTGQVIESGGRFGNLSESSGEMALYVDGSFGSSSSIRSYVEWGEADHGRSSVAVEAGIWDGGFVASAGAPGIAAMVDTPITAADWATS